MVTEATSNSKSPFSKGGFRRIFTRLKRPPKERSMTLLSFSPCSSGGTSILQWRWASCPSFSDRLEACPTNLNPVKPASVPVVHEPPAGTPALPPDRIAGVARDISAHDMKNNLVGTGILPVRQRQAGSLSHQPTRGFTIIELMVVLTIVTILLAVGAKGFMDYRNEYAFSNTVRKLNHAISLAQVRAIQSQSTTWVLIRPALSASLAAPNPLWQPSTSYSVGNIVNDGRSTYYCIVAHTSSAAVSGEKYDPAGNEPGVGAQWKTDWVEISDYRYNDSRFDIQDWTTGSAVDASPFNSTNPAVFIPFNWMGVPVLSTFASSSVPPYTYGQPTTHKLRVISKAKTAGTVQFTVTYMGKILQGAAQ